MGEETKASTYDGPFVGIDIAFDGVALGVELLLATELGCRYQGAGPRVS